MVAIKRRNSSLLGGSDEMVVLALCEGCGVEPRRLKAPLALAQDVSFCIQFKQRSSIRMFSNIDSLIFPAIHFTAAGQVRLH